MEKEKDLSVRRDEKNSLFCDLFSDKKRALSPYNAINGTSYDDPSQLEVVTLSEAIFLHQKNDVSILFDAKLTLWEHQSTVNPNMPLRGLLYYAQNMEGLIGDKWDLVYRRTLVKIPTPDYYVLYNGTEKQPERMELRLSDAFQMPTDGYEWTAHVLNINPGNNEGVVRKCPELSGYVALIQYIRENQEAGISREEAVDQALDRCIKEGYLVDYLRKIRGEARRMLWGEFNEEEWKKAIRADARDEYLEEGRKQGIEQGEDRLSLLMLRLRDAGREEDAWRVATDPDYRRKAFREFGDVMAGKL